MLLPCILASGLFTELSNRSLFVMMEPDLGLIMFEDTQFSQAIRPIILSQTNSCAEDPNSIAYFKLEHKLDISLLTTNKTQLIFCLIHDLNSLHRLNSSNYYDSLSNRRL